MRILIIICVLFILPLLGLGIFEILHWNKTYPNISIGTIELGGLTKQEVIQKLNIELSKRQNQTLTFEIPQYEVKGFKLNPNLISYDVEKMANQAIQVGRQGELISQIQTKLSLVIRPTTIDLSYDFDELTTDTLLADMLRQYEKEVLESRIKFEAGEIFATVSKEGRIANRDALRKTIKDYVTLTSDTTTATVEIRTEQPKITQSNSRNAINQAQIAISKPLVLREPSTGYEKTLDSNEIFDLLEFSYNTATEQTQVSIANYKLAQLLSDIPSSLNSSPIEGKSEQIGNITVILEEARSGTVVDIQKLTTDIETQIFTAGRSEIVQIPVTRIEPALTKATINQYGIKAKLAEGTSSFKGSSAARLHNIRTAVAKLNGHLIAPNATFSMYAVIGDIEKSTGYTDSVIIKNGRSVPGVGGGVCQVSTSLFRAALQAGLPISERRPHSFRVSYYEQDGPPGFDAAIYFPDWDFKFRNDTGTHIAIQTILDESQSKLTINFWGAPDGRTINISQPEITDRKPAPPEVRIESANVPKGTIRQTEFAAEGARVNVVRTITKNNQTQTENFVSIYRPWQSVYLIGTGE